MLLHDDPCNNGLVHNRQLRQVVWRAEMTYIGSLFARLTLPPNLAPLAVLDHIKASSTVSRDVLMSGRIRGTAMGTM